MGKKTEENVFFFVVSCVLESKKVHANSDWLPNISLIFVPASVHIPLVLVI